MNPLPRIEHGHSGNISFNPRRKVSRVILLAVYCGMMLCVFGVLGVRLFQLTIVRGAYYRDLAEHNRIHEITIESRRGTITDRTGMVLVSSNTADPSQDAARYISHRTYVNGEVFAPIIGYRQMADEVDIASNPCMNPLKSGDKTGKKGIEQIQNCSLAGKNGKKLIEVDAHGAAIRTLSIIPPQDGDTIRLSVDAKLQTKAYELLKGKKGAIVAYQPNTGDVLALVSSPSYNPQAFEDGTPEVSGYFTSPDKPLFSRPTEGTYPPGSLFKLSMAAGVLEEKKMDENTIVEDKGSITAGPLTFHNWYFLEYGKTDGMVNMVKAIQRSNDIFFYKVGETLGPELMKSWAEKFGYGKKTGIGLVENEGLLPSPFWKTETLKEQWYLGDSYNLSIGQGFVLTTPAQVNVATSILANNGVLCRPKLLRDEAPNCKPIGLSDSTITTVRQGMLGACQPGGTGWPFFEFMVNKEKVAVGCKTGTAESHGENTKPHAWFTVFAPFDSPQIALTVLIEEAGQGSDEAAPIAKQLLQMYLGG